MNGPAFPNKEIEAGAAWLRPFRVRVDFSGGRGATFQQIAATQGEIGALEAALGWLEGAGWLLPVGVADCWQIHPLLLPTLPYQAVAVRAHALFFQQLAQAWIEEVETMSAPVDFPVDFASQEAPNLEQALLSAASSGVPVEQLLSALDSTDRQRGKHLQRIHRLERLLPFLENKELGQSSGQSQLEYVGTLELLAHAYGEAHRPVRAEALYRQLYTLSKAKLGDSTDSWQQIVRVNTLLQLVRLLRERKAWAESERLLEEALTQAAILPSPEYLADAYWAKGLWHKEQRQWVEAETWLKKAVDLTTDQYKKGLLLVNRAAVADDQNALQLALQLNVAALEIFQHYADIAPLGKVFTNMGLLYADAGQPQQATYYGQQALEWYLRRGDQLQIAACFQNLGNLYFDVRDLESAEEYYLRALTAYRYFEQTGAEAEIYQNLSEVHRFQGRFDEAIADGRRACTLFRALGDSDRENDALLNLGSALLQGGQETAAAETYALAQTGFSNAGHLEGLGKVARNLAELARRRDQTEAVADLLLQSADWLGQAQAQMAAADLIAYANYYADLTGHRDLLEAIALRLNAHFMPETMQQLVEQARIIYKRMG